MSKRYYLDSSALIKRYVAELGSTFIDKLFDDNASFFFASFLTYAEVNATLARLCRMGFISSTNKMESLKNFEKDWRGLSIVAYSDVIRETIPALTDRFPLSGADSIQLACAASLKKHAGDFTFLTSDQRLLNAANDFGLKAIDPALTR